MQCMHACSQAQHRTACMHRLTLQGVCWPHTDETPDLLHHPGPLPCAVCSAAASLVARAPILQRCPASASPCRRASPSQLRHVLSSTRQVRPRALTGDWYQTVLGLLVQSHAGASRMQHRLPRSGKGSAIMAGSGRAEPPVWLGAGHGAFAPRAMCAGPVCMQASPPGLAHVHCMARHALPRPARLPGPAPPPRLMPPIQLAMHYCKACGRPRSTAHSIALQIQRVAKGPCPSHLLAVIARQSATCCCSGPEPVPPPAPGPHTYACTAAGRQLPPGCWEEIIEGLRHVEQEMGCKLGDAANPLLLSVRSGAAVRQRWGCLPCCCV